jgi:hypothetical protein
MEIVIPAGADIAKGAYFAGLWASFASVLLTASLAQVALTASLVVALQR